MNEIKRDMEPIDPELAKEVLKRLTFHFIKGKNRSVEDTNLILNALNAGFDAIKQQQNDRWIPVSTQPPEVKDGEWAVFIIPNYFTKSSYKITARYFKDHGINHEDGWTDKRVITATYWMPLQDPLPHNP